MTQDNSTSPKVFIIQQSTPRASDGWTPNLEPATKFGALHFIFDASDKPHLDPPAAMKKAIGRLRDFDGERDYLCWSNFGDPAAMWSVVMLLAGTGTDTIRFLYWSRGKGSDGRMSNQNGFYFPVEISIRNLKYKG